VLEVCRAEGAALTCRGGGTSIAGNAIGPGVVVDLSRHLNRIGVVDPAARTVVVEPGAVLDDISRAGAPFGLRFGPDPSTHSRATIGGSLANNACGARALRYGRSVDNVVDLDVLLADGTRFTAGRLADAPAQLREPLTSLVAANLSVIRQNFGTFSRQGSGYLLDALLPEQRAELARFLCGTEGTLAVTLGATVRLVERPSATALVVLGYPDIVAAAAAVPGLLSHDPVSLEGMDARLIQVLRTRGRSVPAGLPDGEGYLLLELAGATLAEAIANAEKAKADSQCLAATVLHGEAAQAMFRAREDGGGLGGRTPADQPAWPGWEDAAVPPERLAEYLRDFRQLLDRFGFDGLLFGHFGDGCVHVRIDFPLQERPALFRDFVHQAAELVVGYGGSMSGEHGDGRARGALLAQMYPPAALELFSAVKGIFDPSNLLNPGVIVDPPPVDDDLRMPLVAASTGRRLALAHDGGDLATAVHRCVGIGRCRAVEAGPTVMCPSYVATRDEKDSTRGRARVLQEATNGQLIGGLRSKEVLESLDLCLSCKGCSSDCPAGVDMASYKAEVLHERYRHRLRPLAHYSLGWLPAWSRVAARAPRLVNTALRRGPTRLLKRLAGVDRRRALPAFAPSGLRSQLAHHDSPAAGRPVVLWVDTFTDRFSPEVGIAAVRVLEAAGYRVELSERGAGCCGLTWISTGQLDVAGQKLKQAMRTLAPDARAGVPIVVLEPSCAAVFRSDAVELLPEDPDAAVVARAVRTVAELLVDTPGWQPPDLTHATGVVQPHCHHHAVLGWDTDRDLLARAGARFERVGGCCGLAGNWGAERGHYDLSMAIAESNLLPALRSAGPAALVLADGFSCRTQIAETDGRRALTLVELLAQQLPPAPTDIR
jgi:FAD/FMN-containing dehydrogenase/Fe-S oxidoreductase